MDVRIHHHILLSQQKSQQMVSEKSQCRRNSQQRNETPDRSSHKCNEPESIAHKSKNWVIAQNWTQIFMAESKAQKWWASYNCKAPEKYKCHWHFILKKKKKSTHTMCWSPNRIIFLEKQKMSRTRKMFTWVIKENWQMSVSTRMTDKNFIAPIMNDLKRHFSKKMF